MSRRVVFLSARAAYLRELLDGGADEDGVMSAVNFQDADHVFAVASATFGDTYELSSAVEHIDGKPRVAVHRLTVIVPVDRELTTVRKVRS